MMEAGTPIDRTPVPRRRALTLALLTFAYFFSFMDRQILAILVYGTPLTLNIMAADGSGAIETAQTTLAQPLLVGQFVYVPFGSWLPSQGGNLPVNVSSGGIVQGQITGTYYVGDKPQGAFAVAPTDVFIGNQTVHGTIDVTGSTERPLRRP